jgi:hypothetical protein
VNGPGVRAGLREAPPAKSRRHGVKPPAPSPIGNVRRFFPGVSSPREKAPIGSPSSARLGRFRGVPEVIDRRRGSFITRR